MVNLKSNLLQLFTRKPEKVERKKRRRSEEQSHQAALFKWLSLWSEDVRSVTFHIPNGGSRNPIEAKILKGQGVTAGIPDIFMAIPNLLYHGLFIEMKSKAGKVTQSQEETHKRLRANGYCVLVCYDWFKAKEAIIEYLKPKKGNNNVKCPAA